MQTENKLLEAAEGIKQFSQKMQEYLKELPAFSARAAAVLATLESGFRHAAGDQNAPHGEAFKPTPITHVLGIDVQQRTSPAQTIAQQVSKQKDKDSEAAIEQAIKERDERMDKLRKDVDAAYETFATRKPGDIVKNVEDVVIRGVARKAGMVHVTTSVPERITNAFVEEVQAKMKEQQA